MRKSIRILSSAAAILIAALALSVPAPGGPADLGRARLVVETTSAFEHGDTIAVRFAARLANTSTDSKHLAWTGELRSLASGAVVGTLTHDITCLGAVALPCLALGTEAVDTFTFPQGTIVNRALLSAAPDPGAPGLFLIGIHPDAKSIVSATGAFAGRTGTAHMSGRHDGREVPTATFDDFWLIELDPRA
jgi:hypothetical protein